RAYTRDHVRSEPLDDAGVRRLTGLGDFTRGDNSVNQRHPVHDDETFCYGSLTRRYAVGETHQVHAAHSLRVTYARPCATPRAAPGALSLINGQLSTVPQCPRRHLSFQQELPR